MTRDDLAFLSRLTQRTRGVTTALLQLVDCDLATTPPEDLAGLQANLDDLEETCARLANVLQDRQLRRWKEQPTRPAPRPAVTSSLPGPTPVPPQIRVRRFDLQGRER